MSRVVATPGAVRMRLRGTWRSAQRARQRRRPCGCVSSRLAGAASGLPRPNPLVQAGFFSSLISAATTSAATTSSFRQRSGLAPARLESARVLGLAHQPEERRPDRHPLEKASSCAATARVFSMKVGWGLARHVLDRLRQCPGRGIDLCDPWLSIEALHPGQARLLRSQGRRIEASEAVNGVD